METLVLELIKPLTLTKEDFPPINFEEGTVLKVLSENTYRLLGNGGLSF